MATPTPLSTGRTQPGLWGGTIRLMTSPPRSAEQNMAFDEAMLTCAAESGETLLRLYSWDRPSVSFGRNQRCHGVYSAARCEQAGVPAVRRLTGGRALLHGREVTYSVAAPTTAAPTLRGGYEAINSLLVDALQTLGVAAERFAPGERTRSPELGSPGLAELGSPGLAPCFETPSAGELVVGARKLVGSAQHRGAAAFLQHGSILLDDDQSLLHTIALQPLPPVPPPATLQQFGITDPTAVAESIAGALRRTATGDIVVSEDSAIPERHLAVALRRYRDPLWTWRR